MEEYMKPYTVEELNTRLDRVNSWIDNCDQKASILLAFAGALAAVLLTSDILTSGHERLIVPFVNYWSGDKDILFSFPNLVIFLSLLPIVYHVLKMVVFLLLVLNPKTKIDELEVGAESRIEKNSAIHYGVIAPKKYNDFNDQCKEQNEENYLNDLCSQIYCNSKICNDKFDNYKKGLNHFMKLLGWCAFEIVFIFFF